MRDDDYDIDNNVDDNDDNDDYDNYNGDDSHHSRTLPVCLDMDQRRRRRAVGSHGYAARSNCLPDLRMPSRTTSTGYGSRRGGLH